VLGVSDRFFPLTDRIHSATTVELSEAALAVDAGITKLCAGLSEEQLSWRPRPGRWSIAENLAHLRTTTEVFLPVVDSALEASRKLKLHGEGPFTLNLYGRLLVWGMEARPVVKTQVALRRRIADADGLDLTALRFPSPVANYFRVNLLEFFSAFNAHSRRHLWQANKVRRAMPPSTLQNRA